MFPVTDMSELNVQTNKIINTSNYFFVSCFLFWFCVIISKTAQYPTTNFLQECSVCFIMDFKLCFIKDMNTFLIFSMVNLLVYFGHMQKFKYEFSIFVSSTIPLVYKMFHPSLWWSFKIIGYKAPIFIISSWGCLKRPSMPHKQL